MPKELETLYMTDNRTTMTDNRTTVANFIRSRPAASAPFLISAASECLRRKYPLNSCELHSMARELRYAN